MAVEARATDNGGSGARGAGEPDDDLPARIDRYVPLRKLATGGMAELFLAKQSGLEGFEKVVVIKQILAHLSQDKEFVEMFLDEARIAAKLSHPNIVQIYDLGHSGDSYYIAMEYVSGRNIQHLITKMMERGEPIPTEHVLRVIAGVCDGLYYAHSRKDYDGTPLNIVHRDISPQNVLVSFAGGVKLVDFGIAKASTQLAQTRAGVLKGKYAYMSPEQVRGAKIDQRSDIFSVGLVMYEMLTGHRAFERDNSLKTLKAIVQEKPLNPKELNPGIPDAVIKLLSKALEKNPDRRYATAQDMQLAIEDYLESSPKKSNNVRLSRFMYEVFDDELNAEGGTMIVQGVGEVIIPTGVKGKPKPKIEEEVDHKTLSAALAPEAPAADGNANARAGKPAPAPASRVVHDEKSKSAVVSAEVKRPAEPARDERAGRRDKPAAAARPPAATVPDDEDSAEESVEDKTIPVYDLEEYEKKRAAKQTRTDAGKSDGHFSEDETKGGLSPVQASMEGDDDATRALGKTDEISKSLIRDAKRAAAHVADDDDGDDQTSTLVPDDNRFAGFGGTDVNSTTNEHSSDLRVPNTGPSGEQWDGGTVELAGGTALEQPLVSEPLGLPGASDAVPGLGPAGGIRPAGSPIRPAAGVRPAAAPGVPLARAIQDRVVTGAVAMPQHDGTPVTRDAPPAPGPSTPAAAMAPRPAAPPSPSTGKLPTWAIAAIAAIVVFMFASIAIGIVVIVKLSGGSSAPAAAWVQVEVRTTPSDAAIAIDGEAKPASVVLIPAGAHKLTVTKDGFAAVERELDVKAPGPLVVEVELKKE